MICLGGKIVERPHVLCGDETVENAQRYPVNKMFFSVDSVTPDGQIHSTHYLLYKTILKNCQEAYFLTDQTKITQWLDKTLCDFSVLSGVISDFKFPEETQAAYPHVRFICATE